MTKIIKFFSNFCDSNNCKEVYERLCETKTMDNYGKGKDYIITTGEDYNFAVIINTAMPELKLSKENVIGLAFEPNLFLDIKPEFIEYAKKYIGKYYIGNKDDLPEPFIEDYAYMWHITPLKSIPEKKNLISIMISEKIFAPGHAYRHVLAQEIIKRKLPVDIYGRGCMYYMDMKLPNVKGRFQELEPYQSYHFHIAIENFQTNGYFSEKITNPLLCGTTPIYLGCKKIEKYFPNEVIHLSHDINRDIKIIEDIIKNPKKYKKQINIDSIKKTINLLENFNKLL
jgi:hypothetical protein